MTDPSPLDFLDDPVETARRYQAERARAQRREKEVILEGIHGVKVHCFKCGKVIRTQGDSDMGTRKKCYCFDCTDTFKGDF